MITPLDIQNKEFKRGIRGYKEDEVDEFLDEIMIYYEKLYKENNDLKEKLKQYSHQIEQYENIEETLKNTLIVAQNAAEEVRTNALKKSELIIAEAENNAKEIVAKAYHDMEELQKEYEELKRQVEIFKTRYKTLLQSQLDTFMEACDEILEGNESV